MVSLKSTFNTRKVSIYAGSNEIQRNIMSKLVLGALGALNGIESQGHIGAFVVAVSTPAALPPVPPEVLAQLKGMSPAEQRCSGATIWLRSPRGAHFQSGGRQY